MFRISACVCAFFLLACCVLPMAAQPPAGAANATLLPPLATIYYGCVNNSTGAIRIVNKTTSCKSSEHKIHWDQTGPTGPPDRKENRENRESRDHRDLRAPKGQKDRKDPLGFPWATLGQVTPEALSSVPTRAP